MTHVRYSQITAEKWCNDLVSEGVVEEHLIECSCEWKMSLCRRHTDDVAKERNEAEVAVLHLGIRR